jgi:hypothetical protein
MITLYHVAFLIEYQNALQTENWTSTTTLRDFPYNADVFRFQGTPAKVFPALCVSVNDDDCRKI